MFKILADTCVWENLAKDPQQRRLLNVIFELETSGDLGLIVPRIVLEEFERRKERISKENTHSVSSLLKRIKAIVGKHGDGEGKAYRPGATEPGRRQAAPAGRCRGNRRGEHRDAVAAWRDRRND